MKRRVPALIITALSIAGCLDENPVRVKTNITAEIGSAASLGTQSIVYSQTSLAGSDGTTPGLFDQLGLLAGPTSERRDFYEIFTNETDHTVRIDKAIIYGSLNTASRAVLVPVVIGTVNDVPSILIPDTVSSHSLATTPVPVGPTTIGLIEISFSPAVEMSAGARLAFGFIVPLATTVDATLWGTDVLPNTLSASTPPYYTGFYATSGSGELGLAVGNHYLVIEATAPTIQDVIDFLDVSVQSGALSGSGPGHSAQGRMGALRNMLAAAADLIANADIRGAIALLETAYLRTDGEPQPPDFVTGAAAPTLASEIKKLIASLGG